MKGFAASRGKWREFDVKVTLQSGVYKGDFVFQIRGNISPFSALTDLDLESDSVEPVKNNCGYKESEDDEGSWWFEALLKNESGDTCRVEDECCFLEDYIVALEIVDCKNYKI